MAITLIRDGSIFDSQADALVNPVNCVGVMGKGLALEFKRRFPRNFRYYKIACFREELKIGSSCVFYENGKFIINYPTKKHWKESSHIAYIAMGFSSLAFQIQLCSIESIAVPALGCGLGGLKWSEVEPVIRKMLNEIPVEAELYAPQA